MTAWPGVSRPEGRAGDGLKVSPAGQRSGVRQSREGVAVPVRRWGCYGAVGFEPQQRASRLIQPVVLFGTAPQQWLSAGGCRGRARPAAMVSCGPGWIPAGPVGSSGLFARLPVRPGAASVSSAFAGAGSRRASDQPSGPYPVGQARKLLSPPHDLGAWPGISPSRLRGRPYGVHAETLHRLALPCPGRWPLACRRTHAGGRNGKSPDAMAGALQSQCDRMAMTASFR